MSRPAYSAGVKGGPQVKSLIFQLSGLTLIAFANALTFKARMPERGKVIGCTMNATAKGGTHSTSTIDVRKDATSLLVAAFDLFAHTPGTPIDKEGSALAAAADVVAKDSEIRIVTAESGGTSPTVQGLVIQVDYVPLGD